MTDESNRSDKPVANPNTGGRNRTATGQGPQRQDDQPQVAPEDAPAARRDAGVAHPPPAEGSR